MYGIDIPNGFTIMEEETPIMEVGWYGIDVTSKWLITGDKNRLETFLPPSIYPENITFHNMEEWISTRTVPKERYDLKRILKQLYKIPVYLPIEMCRLDHGIQYGDFTWIKWNGESINYDSIKLR